MREMKVKKMKQKISINEAIITAKQDQNIKIVITGK
jgi:hypothetical protein